MQPRTTIKDNAYFQRDISEKVRIMNRTHDWFKAGKILPEHMCVMKNSVFEKYKSLVLTKYSAGYAIQESCRDVKICTYQLISLIYYTAM